MTFDIELRRASPQFVDRRTRAMPDAFGLAFAYIPGERAQRRIQLVLEQGSAGSSRASQRMTTTVEYQRSPAQSSQGMSDHRPGNSRTDDHDIRPHAAAKHRGSDRWMTIGIPDRRTGAQ